MLKSLLAPGVCSRFYQDLSSPVFGVPVDFSGCFSRGFPRRAAPRSFCSQRNKFLPRIPCCCGREAGGCLFSGNLSHFHGNAKGARWNPLIRIPHCGSARRFLRWGNPSKFPWKSQTGFVPQPHCVSTKTNLKSSQEFGSVSGKPAQSSA